MAHFDTETERLHQEAYESRMSSANLRQVQRDGRTARIYARQRSALIRQLPLMIRKARHKAALGYRRGYPATNTVWLPLFATPIMYYKREDSLSPIIVATPITNLFIKMLEKDSRNGQLITPIFAHELLGYRFIIGIRATYP